MTAPPSLPGGERRRTQAQRRADTIAALVDATIATISEVGYHGTTATEICARAGVSQGALFHHFPTLVDLVVTALGRMTEQRIARYVEFADDVMASVGEPADLLRMAGQLAGDPVATVWAEVTIAARTDLELRQRVGPAIEARWSLIRAAATAFPGLAVMDPLQRDAWLQLLRGTLELAPLVGPLATDGDAAADERRADARNQALLVLAEHLGARFGGN
jgi:AcrR family transcriptional regulator